MTTVFECGNIARTVLGYALSQALCAASSIGSENWGSEFGKLWIRALLDSFRNIYQDEECYAVFSRAYSTTGATKAWRRQEYLYDVTVATTGRLSAPIRTGTDVTVIKECLWQAESEVAQNASAVAEDLGKLVLGSGASKLFIVAHPEATANLNAWTGFIEDAARHVPGNFFLAVMPTYSTLKSAHKNWRAGTASIRLFRRFGQQLMPDVLPISANLSDTIG